MSYAQFSFWRPFCFFGGHFVFSRKELRRVIVNYHVKSGASSLKIDWVMLNFCRLFSFFDGHFVFCRPFFLTMLCGGSTWTSMQNLELLAWKLTELWAIAPICTGEFVSEFVSDDPRYRVAFTTKIVDCWSALCYANWPTEKLYKNMAA